jgi:hypothetical protein
MEASIIALEHSFLKVPHEQVCKTSRCATHGCVVCACACVVACVCVCVTCV